MRSNNITKLIIQLPYPSVISASEWWFVGCMPLMSLIHIGCFSSAISGFTLKQKKRDFLSFLFVIYFTHFCPKFNFLFFTNCATVLPQLFSKSNFSLIWNFAQNYYKTLINITYGCYLTINAIEQHFYKLNESIFNHRTQT